jgi:hypothetical protein
VSEKKSAGNAGKGNASALGISYHPIPMTLELSRRKEEEELRQKYHIPKEKKAVLIGQPETDNVTDPEPLIIRYTNVFNTTEADLLNHWTADKPAHISRSEMLKIVDFYSALVGQDFEETCTDIKAKISLMTDDLWNDYANRLPFALPY